MAMPVVDRLRLLASIQLVGHDHEVLARQPYVPHQRLHRRGVACRKIDRHAVEGWAGAVQNDPPRPLLSRPRAVHKRCVVRRRADGELALVALDILLVARIGDQPAAARADHQGAGVVLDVPRRRIGARDGHRQVLGLPAAAKHGRIVCVECAGRRRRNSRNAGGAAQRGQRVATEDIQRASTQEPPA